MESDRSRSQDLDSGDDLPTSGNPQHDINGDSRQTSAEPSGRYVNGDHASGDEDGDLFGDESGEEHYVNPYAIGVFNVGQI